MRASINFCDEIIEVNLPGSFVEFKKLVSGRYDLEVSDVDELIIFYVNLEKSKVKMTNEIQYQQAFFQAAQMHKNRKEQGNLLIILEVSEASKLYKREFENSVVANNKNLNEEREKLEREILEKQNLLKKSLEADKLRREEAKLALAEKAKKEEEQRKEELKLKEAKLAEEEKARLQEELKLKEEMAKKIVEKEKAIEQAKILEEEERRNKLIKEMSINNEEIRSNKASNNSLRESSDFYKVGDEDLHSVLSKVITENLDNAKNDILQSTLKTTNQIMSKIKKSSVTNTSVHNNVRCDSCGMNPIIGNRYKCTVCIDFDFCEDCEDRCADQHEHPFLKIRNPNNKPIEIRCSINASNKSQNIINNNINSNEFNINVPEQNINETIVEAPKEEIVSEEKPKENTNILDKVMDKIDKIPNKVENFIKETLKIGGSNSQKNKYKDLVQPFRREFLMENTTDVQIINALEQANGDFEVALGLIFADK